MTDKLRGTCPVCKRDYNLSPKPGLIPKHWARDAKGKVPTGLPLCAGAGRPPKTR